jgi:monoamine oxidase
LHGSRTLGARLAIVTLPVGVLRHRGDRDEVTFEPRLPASTSAAIAHLEVGHAIRIGLVFKTPFWERLHGGRYRSAGFFRTDGQPFPAYWTQFPTRRNYVVAWAGGPHAIALHDVAPDERIALALDGFAALFGESRLVKAEFEAAVTHDWSRDRFARGAYSYVTVGGSEAREALARPVQNTLFFAGEATSADGQGGTVNGALASGARAAELAVAALGVSAAKDG